MFDTRDLLWGRFVQAGVVDCARQAERSRGAATSQSVAVWLYTQPPACVVKNGRSQAASMLGIVLRSDYCFERKRTSRERLMLPRGTTNVAR